MGITGLLPFLKDDGPHSALRKTHIVEFKGKRAGVDAYSWLHKAIFSCAQDLFIKKPTKKYVDYCMRQVALLMSYGVVPVLVFDGGKMPFKFVDKKRHDDRKNARQQAADLIALGRTSEAFKHMVQAIDVTHEMAYHFITAAREIHIDCIVAPYEADAQLAFLQKEKFIDVIITEDSDLIVFGCETIFFKMSSNGDGELYERSKLEVALKMKSIKFREFKFDKFRHAAIMSGCDYVKNLPGIGLIKAWKFMNCTEIEDIRTFLKKIPSYLKLKVTIDKEYVKNFVMAEMSFLYQYVFDPIKRQRVTFTEVQEEHIDDFKNFADSFKAIEVDELQLALGNIDRNNRVYGHFSLMNVTGNSIFKCKILERKPEKVVPGNNVCFEDVRTQSVKRPVPEALQERNTDLEDESVINFYKGTAIPQKEKTQFIEPSRKKPRKCKFVKCKEGEDTVLSSFFLRDNKENITSDSFHTSKIIDIHTSNNSQDCSEQSSDSGITSKDTLVMVSLNRSLGSLQTENKTGNSYTDDTFLQGNTSEHGTDDALTTSNLVKSGNETEPQSVNCCNESFAYSFETLRSIISADESNNVTMSDSGSELNQNKYYAKDVTPSSDESFSSHVYKFEMVISDSSSASNNDTLTDPQEKSCETQHSEVAEPANKSGETAVPETATTSNLKQNTQVTRPKKRENLKKQMTKGQTSILNFFTKGEK